MRAPPALIFHPRSPSVVVIGRILCRRPSFLGSAPLALCSRDVHQMHTCHLCRPRTHDDDILRVSSLAVGRLQRSSVISSLTLLMPLHNESHMTSVTAPVAPRCRRRMLSRIPCCVPLTLRMTSFRNAYLLSVGAPTCWPVFEDQALPFLFLFRQPANIKGTKEERVLFGDFDMAQEFSAEMMMLFNEPAIGSHFYPPMILASLENSSAGHNAWEDFDVTAAGAACAADAAASAPPPLPPHTGIPTTTTAVAAAATITAAPMSTATKPQAQAKRGFKAEPVRTVITSPHAAAAAKEALKALPPSSTALTKRRTHNKQEQQQKRRERNRVLAKRTRLRKKFMFQSLETQVRAWKS